MWSPRSGEDGRRNAARSRARRSCEFWTWRGRRDRLGRDRGWLGAVAREVAASPQSVDDFSAPGAYSARCVSACGRRSPRRSCLFSLSTSSSSIRATNSRFRSRTNSSRCSSFLSSPSSRRMLAGRVREQSLGMRTRAQAAQSMFEFSRKLSSAAKLDDVRVGRRRPCAKGARRAIRRIC